MLSTDAKAGLTRLTSLPLKLWICTFTDTTLTDAPAIADLSIYSHARRSIQRTVTCTASVVGVAFTHTTPANAVS